METPGNDATAEEIRDYLLRWVANHYTMLGAYAYAIVRDAEAASDLLGELTVTVARKAGAVDMERPIAPYVRGILRNLCLRVRSRSKSRARPVDPVILDTVSVEMDRMDDPYGLEVRKKALAACMERLSDAARRVVELRYFGGFSYEDIASKLKRSMQSLHAMMYRSHKALAKCVSRRLAEGDER
jgi:RNA polymerase sigma-70 factor (ECF subfamily)